MTMTGDILKLGEFDGLYYEYDPPTEHQDVERPLSELGPLWTVAAIQQLLLRPSRSMTPRLLCSILHLQI